MARLYSRHGPPSHERSLLKLPIPDTPCMRCCCCSCSCCCCCRHARPNRRVDLRTAVHDGCDRPGSITTHALVKPTPWSRVAARAGAAFAVWAALPHGSAPSPQHGHLTACKLPCVSAICGDRVCRSLSARCWQLHKDDWRLCKRTYMLVCMSCVCMLAYTRDAFVCMHVPSCQFCKTCYIARA